MDQNNPDVFETSTYTYELPESLIAQKPLEDRASSRMMVLNREKQTVSHHVFREFPSIVPDNSMLIINNTRVLPVRLRFTRPTGGKGEVLLLKPAGEELWEALCRPSGRMKTGDRYRCGNSITVEIAGDRSAGFKLVRLQTQGKPLEEALLEAGEVPLPPYIKRDHTTEEDTKRYQTVFAEISGSAAAPTAGFHFTDEIMDQVAGQGTDIRKITLHVGAGTFLPVRSGDIRDHTMHHEWYSVPSSLLEETLDPNRTVCAVGTTSVRALEAAALSEDRRQGSEDREHMITGETDLFIYPGFEFRAVDVLLTNFHLPESTLLMLVCAFAGTEFILEAYREAVAEQYRFFSYGDCMLIL